MEEQKKEKIELIKKSFELKNLKRYKEAVVMLYKALECDEQKNDDIEILNQIGDLHIKLKNYDRALDEFQRALSINKNHSHSLQKCYEIYCETNQLQKALKLSQEMCEKNANTQNYYNYIKALIHLEKYQDAIEIFNKIDEKYKLDTNILYLISTINLEKRQLILEKIIELDETHTQANIDLAQIEFENKNYGKVISYCLNVVEENPLVCYYLGKIEHIKQNYQIALAHFLKAIELDYDNHDFYIDLAKTYIDLMCFDDALLALKKSINFSIIKNDINNLDEKYLLSGWILIKQKQLTKANLNLNSIKKESKFYTKAQILIQAINLQNSNLSDVIKELENLSLKENNDLILLDTLASAYKELNLFKKAIETYKKAIELYPNSIFYNLELVDLLIDEKNYIEAIDLINKLDEKCKNCPSLYNSMARIYYRLNKYENALTCLEEYLKLDQNCDKAHYFKGLILNDLERFEDARQVIYTAIKINPTVAKYYNQMSRSYIGLKEYENALLYSKEAIEIEPNEINYKKQAYEISLLIGNKEQIKIYKDQLSRSEKILKLNR